MLYGRGSAADCSTRIGEQRCLTQKKTFPGAVGRSRGFSGWASWSTTSIGSTSLSPTQPSTQPSASRPSPSVTSPAPTTGPMPCVSCRLAYCSTNLESNASAASAPSSGASPQQQQPSRQTSADSSQPAFFWGLAKHPHSPPTPRPSATGSLQTSAASPLPSSTPPPSLPLRSASPSSACCCSESVGD